MYSRSFELMVQRTEPSTLVLAPACQAMLTDHHVPMSVH